MDVSENSGTPKSSILGCHYFWKHPNDLFAEVGDPYQRNHIFNRRSEKQHFLEALAAFLFVEVGCVFPYFFHDLFHDFVEILYKDFSTCFFCVWQDKTPFSYQPKKTNGSLAQHGWFFLLKKIGD